MAEGVMSPSASANGAACQIPYPDRFHAAHSFVSSIPEGAFNDETRLLLYALHKQATQGPCKETKPWSFNVVESAMWKSWQSLGNMSHMEAMRLYVRTVDEEQAEWWTRLPQPQAAGAAAAAAGGAAAAGEAGVSISSVFQENTWVVIQQDDTKKPLPRYEQGAALLGPNLYIMGGHYGGRYLQDVWTYNLNRLQWSAAAPVMQQQQQAAEESGQEGSALLAPTGPPAAAGWSVTPLGDDKLLVMGGHVKVGKLKKGEMLPRMSVWLLDVISMTWTPLETGGDVPCARGGHAACLMPDGSQVLVFGGEDSHRRPLADVIILDLQDLTWSELVIRSRLQPAPRSAAAATLYNEHLLVFGGGSIASCYNDVWLLDVERASWSRPEVRSSLPSPRAGHSGVLVGDMWYVLGGGNNVKGCTDMLAMDLSELFGGHVTWSKVCSVPPGSPLSSEGISLLHAPELNLLVAFGGYNGKYHNSVSVYKLPADQQQEQEYNEQYEQQYEQQQQQQAHGSLEQQQEDQVQHRTQSLPAMQQGLQGAAGNGPTANGVASPAHSHGQNLLKELAVSREQLKRDLAAARQELELVAGAADAAKEEAAAEVHMLRRQLSAAQAQAEEAQKVAEDARHALSAEQAKTLKLEAQLAELSDKLGSVGELERELARYRQVEAEGKKKGSSGSLWGYISGSS